WQRGVGGSIPSMAAYVFGVIGMFRLMRGVLSPEGEPSAAVGVAAWTAAAVYGANPNLIYMDGTAMGEALYLALFVWAVVFFAEFAGGAAGGLQSIASNKLAVGIPPLRKPRRAGQPAFLVRRVEARCWDLC